MSLPPDVLAILVCPVPDCRAPLREHERGLHCPRCGRLYRMEECWPVLIPEEAEQSAASREPHA